MNELVIYGLAFIVLIVIIAIGGSVAVMADAQTQTTLASMNVTSPSWYTTTVANAGQALQTYGGFLPIVAIAIVGGVAIFYVLRFASPASK